MVTVFPFGSSNKSIVLISNIIDRPIKTIVINKPVTNNPLKIGIVKKVTVSSATLNLFL